MRGFFCACKLTVTEGARVIGWYHGEYKRREVRTVARDKYKAWLEPAGLERLAEMAARLTDAEMAREMGVSSSTYYDWLKKYPEMAEAVTGARAGADARANNERVESSLFELACGCVRKIKKPIKVRSTSYDARGRRVDRERVVYADEEVFVPPNVKAQIFWLTNRAPERWRNRIEAAVNDESGVSFAFREATAEEAAEYAD